MSLNLSTQYHSMSTSHKGNYFGIENWMLGVLLSLCTTFLSPTLNAQTNTASGPVIPTISMHNAPLSQAVDLLAREAGLNYILDPQFDAPSRISGGKPAIVSFDWANISARDALYRLLKEHDLVLVENPVTSVARIGPASLHIKPVDAAELGSDTNAVIPVMMMTEAPLDFAIQSCANQLHRKVVVDEAVRKGSDGREAPLPAVSFRWRQLTARQALVALLDVYGMAMVEDSATSTLRIVPEPKS